MSNPPSDGYDPAQVGAFSKALDQATGESLESIDAEPDATEEETYGEVARAGIITEVVRLPKSQRGFVLRPRRWMVERSFGGMARLRRFASDYRRRATTREGMACCGSGIFVLHETAPVLAVLST